MSTYNFNAAQRYAIFVTHGMKCYLNGCPLALSSMEVDHILPERLLDDNVQFAYIRSIFGLTDTFSINSYENWLPACGPCNLKKGQIEFEVTPLIQIQLQKAAAKAAETSAIADKAISNRQVSRALGALEKAHEEGKELDGETLRRLADIVQFSSAQGLIRKGQTIMFTQSYQLRTTTVEDARSWGVTHWTIPSFEEGEAALVVLLREEEQPDVCSACEELQHVFQPINQEGGPGPVCVECMSEAGWMQPVAVGDLPTHVTNDAHDGP